jgi:hypothetical protein
MGRSAKRISGRNPKNMFSNGWLGQFDLAELPPLQPLIHQFDIAALIALIDRRLYTQIQCLLLDKTGRFFISPQVKGY